MYILLLTLATALLQPGQASISNSSHVAAVSAPVKEKPIKRGAPLTGAPVVSLDDVLKNPSAYADKTVKLEGVVNAVCTRKGCWMEIARAKGSRGVRVTFKDYGFFVPTNSKGMKVLAEGTIVVETMSAEDVEHMVSEGASVNRNADGTATEVRFVASGVELRRK